MNDKLIVVFVCFLVIKNKTVLSHNTPPRFKSDDLDDLQSEIVVRVKEGQSSLNKQIYHLSGEDSDGDPLKFGVLGTLGADLLRIEPVPPNEAKVFLKKELDREIQDSYTLVLTLTDGKDGKGNYITKSLLLIVEDINDNTPVFRPYQTAVTLSEASKPGIVIQTIEAFDSDEGRFGQVLYELWDNDNQESTQPSNTFSIETIEGKGVISLVSNLDFERKSIYQLKVLAIDRAVEEERRTATAALVIQLEDAEDEPPVFTFVPSVTRIAEDLAIGSTVLAVTAVDGDRGVNNAVTYRIIKGDQKLFQINQNTGVVSVGGRLDRESNTNSIGQTAGSYILEIEATEVTVAVFPPPTVQTEVTIILTDVNDEIPRFRSDQYLAEIPENAPNDMPVTFVGDSVPLVYDLDQGNNGSFALSIQSADNKGLEDVFYVTPVGGVNEASIMLRVKDSSRLDYEKVKQILLKLIATEKVGPQSTGRSSSAQVTINIKDTNDNIPQFDRDLYYGSVPENAVKGTTVAKIKARDVDTGIFGTDGIRYTEIRGEMSSALHLDPKTGVITVRTSDHKFDRELSAQHFLIVEARDANGSGNRNSIQLVLNITDFNDCPPKFFHDKYEARLYENSHTFEQPIRITAFDGDAIGSPNSEIRYKILSNNNSNILTEYSNNFTIDEITGVLTVKAPVDFESIPGPKSDSRNITFKVRAHDLGEPRLYSDAQVIVYVYDRNDFTPVFTKTLYTKSIPEDIRDGSMVLQVSALDGDHSTINSRIYYRIVSGASDKFIIDSNTGVISVAAGANLDPDRSNPKQLWYFIKVMALDSSFGGEQRSSTANVNITIVDVNNKSPEFVDNEVVVVPEDAPNQYLVTRVVATDLDDKPVLRYSIDYTRSEARNEFGATVDLNLFVDSFAINPLDGTIRVVKILDRELWDQIKLYLVVEDIAASTKGQKAKTILTIRISDVNDNRPLFLQQLYRGIITENAVAGTPIITVNADDADTNKSVIYSLEGRQELLQLIKINHKSGEIVVSERIDRERYSWINITVRATDTGSPPLTGSALLSIQVLDENDNNPVFVGEQRQSYVIAEDAPIGSLVAQISARDDDSGVFGKITYLLDSSSAFGRFKIDRETGAIIVSGALNREDMSQYKLLVQAVDNYEYGFLTGESRKAFHTITVTISDVNDETPKIVALSGDCALINEFHPIRDTIAYISAVDGDDMNTPNGKVSFSINDGNSDRLFDFEQSPPNAAKLVSRFSLRNRVGNYSLTIKLSDGGQPMLSSTAKVKICIIDVNDHNPVFVKPASNITIRVPENATIGATVVEVLATDEDSGVNSLVRYKLRQLPNNHWKWFAINDITGIITLAKTLDRELQRVHELRVQAYDLGEPTSLSTDLDLTILVTNVDDFEPEFTQDIFQVVFTENTLPEIEKYKLLSTIDKDYYDMSDPSVAFKAIPCYHIVGGDGGERFRLNTFTHELTTTVSLDRELKDNYTLIVQATNDCFKVPLNITKFDAKDNSLLQVLIAVRDVNDNAPKMTQKLFTGGFTTDIDFGTVFMEVKAVDSDIGANSVLNYYIISEVKQTLTEGLDTISAEPFVINRITGEISLNFDPQKDMKGYFEFDVLANDTDGLADSAKVYIYLLRDDQRVRFILRLTPQELREKLDKFRDVLANITGATVNIDSYKFHENRDGSVDKKKTDLYLHFVNREDNSILEVNDVLSLIDKNIEYLDELYKEFNVLVTEPTQSLEYFLEWEDQLKACLLGTTSFLALLLVLVICLCLNQKSRYERQLKAATVPVLGAETQLTRCNVPNTNQHASEGSNPMWMTGYDNQWYEKEEEHISDHSSGGNSLDENAIASHSPNESLDGSAGRESGASTSSTTNDKQALCRGLAVGRVTPQNITLPQSNVNQIIVSHNNSNNNSNRSDNQSINNNNININNVKKCAPKPPQKPLSSGAVTKGVVSSGSNVRQSQPKSATNRVNCNPINANQRSVSNVYIESYSPSNHNNNNKSFFVQNSQQINSNYSNNNPNNNTLNQLSLLNLETTEL